MDLNTCAALSEALGLRTIALYSHILPAAIAVFLGFYTLIKNRSSLLSAAFMFFTFAVAIWLIADVVLWTVPNYSLVAFFWSWIDIADVAFFVLATFFFGILSRGGISNAEKIILLIVFIPAFLLNASGNVVTGFDHSWCEMINNDHAVTYKSSAEWVSVALMVFSLIVSWNKSNRKKKLAHIIVFSALLLFLTTFSAAEYIAAQTGIYEISLFALFILPVFLIIMVFAVTNLEIFKIRYLSAQILIYVLIILVASQLLFLQSSTDALLNGLTLALSVVIAVILLQNQGQQMASLVEIENLAQQLSEANVKLKELDQLKSQFLSFASHQLKSPLTAIKWQAQLLIDGTTGKLPEAAVETAVEIEESADHMVELVNEFLNLRKLQEGKMEYHFEPTDIAELISGIVNSLRQLAEHKKLELSFVNRAERTLCAVDRQKFTQVIQNVVDNSIKYTDTGSVRVHIEHAEGQLLNICVTDTGHGIDPAVIDKLFEQFVRDKKDASEIEGTGLGLYIAKQIMDAHGGRIWAESPGKGKGSTFIIQLKTLAP